MILKPELPRRAYLVQAGLILFTFCVTILAAAYALEGGSLWWLVLADLSLMMACGRAAVLLEVWGAIVGTSDILGILLFAMTPFIVPLIAPFALIWTLIQAARAQG